MPEHCTGSWEGVGRREYQNGKGYIPDSEAAVVEAEEQGDSAGTSAS